MYVCYMYVCMVVCVFMYVLCMYVCMVVCVFMCVYVSLCVYLKRLKKKQLCFKGGRLPPVILCVCVCVFSVYVCV
jgi:hypothetical protein